MSVNRIDATLTDAQRDRANAALAALAEALPFLIDLSAKDRADSPKFGDKNRAFVVKARAIAEAHPDMLPGGFNFQEFRTDVQLVESLYPLLHAVETLYGKLTDTYFAAGSEAYAAALLVYRYAKLHHVATRGPGPSLRRHVQQDRAPRPEGIVDARAGWFHPGHEATDVRHESVHPAHGTTDA